MTEAYWDRLTGPIVDRVHSTYAAVGAVVIVASPFIAFFITSKRAQVTIVCSSYVIGGVWLSYLRWAQLQEGAGLIHQRWGATAKRRMATFADRIANMAAVMEVQESVDSIAEPLLTTVAEESIAQPILDYVKPTSGDCTDAVPSAAIPPESAALPSAASFAGPVAVTAAPATTTAAAAAAEAAATDAEAATSGRVPPLPDASDMPLQQKAHPRRRRVPVFLTRQSFDAEALSRSSKTLVISVKCRAATWEADLLEALAKATGGSNTIRKAAGYMRRREFRGQFYCFTAGMFPQPYTVMSYIVINLAQIGGIGGGLLGWAGYTPRQLWEAFCESQKSFFERLANAAAMDSPYVKLAKFVVANVAALEQGDQSPNVFYQHLKAAQRPMFNFLRAWLSVSLLQSVLQRVVAPATEIDAAKWLDLKVTLLVDFQSSPSDSGVDPLAALDHLVRCLVDTVRVKTVVRHDIAFMRLQEGQVFSVDPCHLVHPLVNFYKSMPCAEKSDIDKRVTFYAPKQHAVTDGQIQWSLHRLRIGQLPVTTYLESIITAGVVDLQKRQQALMPACQNTHGDAKPSHVVILEGAVAGKLGRYMAKHQLGCEPHEGIVFVDFSKLPCSTATPDGEPLTEEQVLREAFFTIAQQSPMIGRRILDIFGAAEQVAIGTLMRSPRLVWVLHRIDALTETNVTNPKVVDFINRILSYPPREFYPDIVVITRREEGDARSLKRTQNSIHRLVEAAKERGAYWVVARDHCETVTPNQLSPNMSERISSESCSQMHMDIPQIIAVDGLSDPSAKEMVSKLFAFVPCSLPFASTLKAKTVYEIVVARRESRLRLTVSEGPNDSSGVRAAVANLDPTQRFMLEEICVDQAKKLTGWAIRPLTQPTMYLGVRSDSRGRFSVCITDRPAVYAIMRVAAEEFHVHCVTTPEAGSWSCAGLDQPLDVSNESTLFAFVRAADVAISHPQMGREYEILPVACGELRLTAVRKASAPTFGEKNVVPRIELQFKPKTSWHASSQTFFVRETENPGSMDGDCWEIESGLFPNYVVDKLQTCGTACLLWPRRVGSSVVKFGPNDNHQFRFHAVTLHDRKHSFSDEFLMVQSEVSRFVWQYEPPRSVIGANTSDGDKAPAKLDEDFATLITTRRGTEVNEESSSPLSIA
jgi:hypothetical protein